MGFAPITPLLIPEIAAGAADEVADIRHAAVSVAQWVAQADNVGILIPDTPVGEAKWSLNGFGIAVGEGPAVGLAEGIGRWLLDDRQAAVVGPGEPLTAFDGLLVMGDGSASRTDKAPGHVHPQALDFDDAVVAGLRAGDAEALAGLDFDVAGQVLAAGAAAWCWLGSQTAEVVSPEVDVVTDPFGVLYVVARWTVRWAVPA